MKGNQEIIKIALVFTFISVMTVHPALAENMAAQYLVQSGLRELEKGREEGAIRQFRKAIMLEPQNAEALNYLQQLGASADFNSDSPRKKLWIVEQANQSLAQYQADVARLNSEINRMLFRLERVQHEKDQDRYSYLHESEEMDTELMRIQPESSSELSPQPTDYAYEDESVVQDNYNTPRVMSELNVGSELGFQQWPQQDQASVFNDQSGHQEKLIQIMDDYLDVREQELQSVKNDLIHSQIDLSETQKDLASQIESTQQLNDVYAQVLKKGDGHAFYISEENSYMKFLENKLDESQDQLIEKSARMKEQTVILACLEEELEVSRRNISTLLEEREQLLNQVVYEVNTLREKEKKE